MLIDTLRERTGEHHQRTEKAFDLKASCASKDAYVKHLQTMLALYRPIEEKLGAIDWTGTGIDFESRRKVGWIESDLKALGASTDVPTSAYATALDINDLNAAWGALYVIEGSTLGGQFIRKHIERALGYGPGTGASFFVGYDANTREQWNAYLAAANAWCGDDAGKIETATRKAEQTFETFEQAFHAAHSPTA